MLTRGDQVPHFAVAATDGARVAYGDIWQRKNLLLVSLGAEEPDRYAADVSSLGPRLAEYDTASVVTRDAIPGVPAPGVLIADRWGEVQAVIERRPSEGPSADDLIEWLSYVQRRCPECEGEWR
jgi:hypothetical protein